MRASHLLPVASLTVILNFSGAARAAKEQSFLIRRIAPIFQEKCISCHNPKKSKGGLDLTTRASLLEGGQSGPVVVPGKASGSFLVKLISGPKPKMPLKGQPLTRRQVEAMSRWIDQGAVWPRGLTLIARGAGTRDGKTWWSLRKLARPPLPRVREKDWARTPIDLFILAGLESRGLKPAPQADRAALIRRVTFDLHGLPPTPAEVDTFVHDKGPRAYEKLMDRLLASPRYGERWGRHWLDVVHYGDTHGYDKDKRRGFAWPYRDYVIRSFNKDKPYTRFIKEQLAGDVLYPNDPDGIIATGFIAAGPWDHVGHEELREGTVDKEKTRLLDRDDMVSSTIATFVSMTAHCARCHDHKFDPIPQKDYYRLQAVFAGLDRGDRAITTPRSQVQRRVLEEKQRAAAGRKAALVQKCKQVTSPELTRLDGEIARIKKTLGGLPVLPGKASPTNGYHSGISAKPDVGKWVQVDLGKVIPVEEIRLLPARPTDFPDSPGFGFPPRFRVETSREATFAKPEMVADQSNADFPNPGENPYVIRPRNMTARYVRVTASRLWRRTGDFVFALAELQVDSRGKNVALGAAVTALDSIEAGRWSTKYLVDNFDSRTQLPDLSNPKLAAAFKRRCHLSYQLLKKQRQRAALAQSLVDARTRGELDLVSAELAELEKQLEALALQNQVYAVLSHAPRPIRLLHRGNVEQPRETMRAGALSALADLSFDFKESEGKPEGSRRAALADWIASRRNVLTWRSVANRVWHYHFGKGLVDTPNDFGRNGGRPSHPELLDWLAVEFRDGGQSLKALHRLILLSSTYRQSSRHDPAFARIDADNRYLWRMNRHRMDAESIRDGVLAVSGKMNWRMGGPGFELFRFKPDESPGYDHSALEKINDPRGWRRAVYRFAVRSVPNPFLECLDCADPNINTPVRNTTLTALQALALLNDPFMVKQAGFFAERLQTLKGDVPGQIEVAYRLAFGRLPRPQEKEAMAGYAKKHGLANACRLLFNANEFVFID
jgi:mono/diheme cytochrome c family protein